MDLLYINHLQCFTSVFLGRQAIRYHPCHPGSWALAPDLTLQSIVMILVQLVLLQLCVQYAPANSVYSARYAREGTILLPHKHFWQWNSFKAYCT